MVHDTEAVCYSADKLEELLGSLDARGALEAWVPTAWPPAVPSVGETLSALPDFSEAQLLRAIQERQ